MKSFYKLGAVAMLVYVAFTLKASAGSDFGVPDFPNYMSRPGLVTCDWQYDSYTRACPTPEEPPKVQAPVKSAGKSKVKTKKAN